MYYADKLAILEDLWGKPVELHQDKLIVGSQVYPIIDDVIILLEPSEYPSSIAQRLSPQAAHTAAPPAIATDIQYTFGSAVESVGGATSSRTAALWLGLSDTPSQKLRR